MTDEKREADEQAMDPLIIETFQETKHPHRMGIVSTDWSQSILPRHTDDELEGLRQSIEREGCRNPVVTWRGEIIDGHKRAEICDELGIDYPTIEKDFESRDHAEAWVIMDQVNQRNLDDVGKCEMAEKLERILAEAARKRMSEGGKLYGRGMQEKGMPPDGEPYEEEAAPPLGTYGGLLDSVLHTKGPSIEKAAKLVGIGKETYRRYKNMKDYHTPPEHHIDVDGAAERKLKERRKAWESLSEEEQAARQKAWDELQGKLRGPSPKSTIGEEYKEFDVARKAEARKESQAVRVADANKSLGGSLANKYQPWGPNFPTWCKGEFQLPENLALLPDGSVRLLLSDPPYGQNFNPDDPTREAIPGDVDEDTAAKLLEDMLRLMRPKLAQDAHVVFFVGVKQEPRMRDVLDAATWLTRRSHVVWVKNTHGKGDPMGLAPRHERALHATRGNAEFVNRPTDTFEAKKIRSKDHLTEKPTALLAQLIEAMTVPGEMVADPFGGTASTLVAALELDRRAWGCELLDTNYNAGWTNIDDAIKKKQSGQQPASRGARKIQRPRKSAARHTSQPTGRIGMSMMRSGAPEPRPEPSPEESVAASPDAVVWGWTEA